MLYADSHAHITSETLFPKAEEVLERAHRAGLDCVVNICTEPHELEKGLKLAEKYAWLHNAGATTPHDVDKMGEADFSYFAEMARQGKLSAVGETGLDYHYKHSAPETQQKFLIQYAQLAQACKLPLIIHCRDAFADLFKILDAEYKGPAILHCFTGTLAEAQEVIKRGFYLSLSGIVTFKKSEVLREVARMVPLEKLLIETDAPYLAPQSQRGKVNEPSFLPEVAATIALCKSLSIEDVAKATRNNAREVFRL